MSRSSFYNDLIVVYLEPHRTVIKVDILAVELERYLFRRKKEESLNTEKSLQKTPLSRAGFTIDLK
jgi:hypothetical protein